MKKVIAIILIVFLMILGGMKTSSLALLTPKQLETGDGYRTLNEEIEEYNTNLTISTIVAISLAIVLLVILILYISNKKNDKFKLTLYKLFMIFNIILTLLLFYIRIRYDGIRNSVNPSQLMVMESKGPGILQISVLILYILAAIIGLLCWKKNKSKTFGILNACFNIVFGVANIMTVHNM